MSDNERLMWLRIGLPVRVRTYPVDEIGKVVDLDAEKLRVCVGYRDGKSFWFGIDEVYPVYREIAVQKKYDTLKAINAELVAALEEIYGCGSIKRAEQIADAAIAKAKELK